MATHAGDSSPSLTLSGTGRMDDSFSTINTSKRPRESFDDSFDDGQWDLNDDGRPKTRRVNPQRLAVRLGPDLVAEMEALIVPGAKMPTFTVRKDFQERYNVDRRHIYDYFHSRGATFSSMGMQTRIESGIGLRVAKEDKHTNLIRGRAMKAQAQAQLAALSQPPSSPVVKQEPQSFETALERPFLIESPQSPVKPPVQTIKRSLKVHKSQNKKPRVSTRRVVHRVPKVAKIKRDPSLLATPPLLDSDGSESTLATGSSGTDTDWESATPSCPQFTLPAISDDDAQETCGIPDFMPSPDDFVAGYFESSSADTQQQSILDIDVNLTCDSLDLDSLMTIDEHRLLTREERNELYDLIDSNIPRVSTFDDPPRSYYDYMAEPRSYSDCLPIARHTGAQSNFKRGAHIIDYLPPVIDSPVSVDIPDLRKWLCDDLELYHSDMNLCEYSPTCDNLENSSSLVMSNDTRVDKTPLHSQNWVISGKLPRPVDQLIKQGPHFNIENIRPSSA